MLKQSDWSVLRGFIVINLFFLMPLIWVVTSRVPRIFEAQVVARASTSVKIGALVDGQPVFDRIKGVSASSELQRVQIFLPTDFPTDVFCIQAENAEIERPSLLERFCLRRTYNIEKKDFGLVCIAHSFPLPSLPMIGWVGLVFLEFSLLIITFICSKVNQYKLSTNKYGIGFSLAVASLAAFFFVAIVPTQSVIANRSLFSFPLIDFVYEDFLAFSLTFIALSVGLVLARRNFGYFIHSILIGLILYEYLQIGILSAGAPPMDGEVTYYLHRDLIVRDTLVLIIVLGIFIFAYKWIKPYLKWVVLGLFVMIAASMVDVRRDTHDNAIDSPLTVGFCSKFNVAQETIHSGQRNVMIFVLDSVGTEVSLDAIDAYPELKDAFSGFVAFTNNLAVHQFTEPSVPAITTGVAFDRGMQQDSAFHDYAYSPFGTNSFLYSYWNDGIPISFLPSSFMFGYSSRHKKGSSAGSSDWQQSVFDYRPDTTPPFSLYETVRFRLAPFIAKYPLLLVTLSGTSAHASVKAEHALFPILAAAPIDPQLPCNLEFFHTDGGHAPFDVDREGNGLAVPRTDYQGHLDKTIHVLRELALLLAQYKVKGIYDNSFIAVIADHGWMGKKRVVDAESLHERARTLMWIKPVGADGCLRFSSAPTWHLRFKELIKRSMHENLSVKDVERVLSCEHRFFRALEAKGFVEWQVDSQGVSRKVR